MSYPLYKKTIIPIIFILILSLFLTACGRTQQTLISGKVNIVASFYPLYDFSKKIGGDHVNVINLVPAGVEPHDWSPKSSDMKNLNNAELFVYMGAGFEGWVPNTLASLPKDAKVTVVEGSKGVDLIPAAEDADIQAKEQTPSSPADSHVHEDEMDPHVWLSPINAKKIAQNIKDALIQADSVHQADYEANYNKLADQLDQLHNKYKAQLSQTSMKEIIVTHQSFGYLAKEYGLKQLPIMGMTPDAEPTSKEMKNILQFIKQNNVRYIFFEELVSDKLAKTLAKDANVQTLVLNPIEGLTEEQVKQGADYLSVMESNLNNLVKALQ